MRFDNIQDSCTQNLNFKCMNLSWWNTLPLVSRSSLLEDDGIFFLRKRKDFPNEVFLLEFESEKKVNEGRYLQPTEFPIQ